jgi:hypothetical protein
LLQTAQRSRYAVEVMDQSLEERLSAIQWESFTHPCGFDSREIPSLLVELNSENPFASLSAARQLWNVVAHQGCVGANSVPTLPFLIERLDSAEASVQEEILDILYQFAIAACPNETEPWAKELRAALPKSRPAFVALVNSRNETIAAFAAGILEAIDAKSCRHNYHKPKG